MNSQNDEAVQNTDAEFASPPEPETVEEIRADIEATRDELSQTIDAIQEKLSPQHIKEQVVESVHDATIGKAQDLAAKAQEKLAPVLEGAGEVGERITEAAKPVVRSVKKSVKKNVSKVPQLSKKIPVIVGGAALAVTAVAWTVFKSRRV